MTMYVHLLVFTQRDTGGGGAGDGSVGKSACCVGIRI